MNSTAASPQGSRLAHASDYKIVTFDRPLQWSRSEDEVWLLNPPRRYVLAANQLTDSIRPYIDTVSDLKTGRHYKPLNLHSRLKGAKILVERHRDRGLGDMLFMTGPLSYIQHMAGGEAQIDMYGLVDRSVILNGHPALSYGGAVLGGPIHYDDLPLYDYHWFVDSVTEYDETKDQHNVYDALYTQLGIDPLAVPPKFKRPSLTLAKRDFSDLDSLYHMVAATRNLDLRVLPYYVLAPVSYSSLRVAPYRLWLELAKELSKARPVVLVGHIPGDGQMPSAEMSFGAFYQQLNQMGPRVLNLIGNTSIRVVAALVSRALAAVTLDSGLLYVAQALNIPTVSLWGTHAPSTRIGYDQAYMRYAIHKRAACPAAPCYAYAGFPYTRCARGEQQQVCEPLKAILPSDVLSKLTEIEKEQMAVRQ